MLLQIASKPLQLVAVFFPNPSQSLFSADDVAKRKRYPIHNDVYHQTSFSFKEPGLWLPRH